MLRPATPLSILLLISFVLLLISVISTPIVKGIPIARYEGVNFGVFGWCRDNGECSKIQVGWNTDEVLPATGDSGFSLSSNVRHSLTSLLVVHPVAALCNLIVLGLAIAAHFHSPSHSARYLLGLLILLLPTLLVTLLAFLVDILVFVPHLQWGGWIVLASTILITASGVVTCAMRRTLVSRKARKKRIAENAEMSGANFYARQAEDARVAATISSESKAPMVNGGPRADNLPGFSTYSRQSEERAYDQSALAEPTSATSPVEGGRYYGAPRSRSSSRPRQDYGAPLGAPQPYEDRPPMPQTPSRGGYGPPRGRGNYPPRGGALPRGGFNSRGPPPSPYGRGGYPSRGRGGYPTGPTPPSGFNGPTTPAGMSTRAPPGYGPQGPEASALGYGPSEGVPGASNGTSYYQQAVGQVEPGQHAYSPDDNGPYMAYRASSSSPTRTRASPYGSRSQSPARGRMPQEMPPPMPVMHDQTQYSGQPSHGATEYGMDTYQTRDHPVNRSPSSGHHMPPNSYVPPRSGWSHVDQTNPRSPIRRKRINSGGSDYVEDVDPKFAEPALPSAPAAEHFARPEVPSLLVAGHNPNDVSPDFSDRQINTQIPRSTSYEDLHPGARSPVESETSNFTSISQRPMNPNWQPGHGGEFNSMGPSQRHNQQRRQDMLFSNNPDFELPGVGPPRGNGVRGRGRGGYAGSRQPGPMRPPHPSVLDNMGSDGRYPASVPPTGFGPNGGVVREI